LSAGGKKILAVASGGGHWVQMLRLRPAFQGYDVAFVTIDPRYERDVGERFYVVNDATRWSKLGLVRQAIRVLFIVLRERPRIVISTGASVGYFALLFGKLLGARTVWIDSIANVEKLSMSGELARRVADLHLTQWEHLAAGGDLRYEGAVL
jgi:UDP-N-acetylglucosamine:LPS N-acetylglucosamine transferase